jgi:hypothetical protein
MKILYYTQVTLLALARKCKSQVLRVHNAWRCFGNLLKGAIHEGSDVCVLPHWVPLQSGGHICRRKRGLPHHTPSSVA